MGWLAVDGGHLTLSELGEIDTTDGKASARMQLLYVNLNGGHGILEITRQARVMVTSHSILALAQGSIAEATVSNGGIWNTTGPMYIGSDGQGKLTIREGGTVSANGVMLGRAETGTGEATVDASVWTNTSGLYVGHLGAGTLTIRNKGVVQSQFAHVGNSASGIGNVLVNGSGSTWNTTGPMYIGSDGQGKLTIREGGTVSANGVMLGRAETGTGEATVDASVWTNTSGFFVGHFGVGSLTIQNNSIVQSEFAHIGDYPSGRGNVLVDGSGSTWNIATLLTVGNAGHGVLQVTHQARLATNNSIIGWAEGSSGEATVSDGATWNTIDPMYVGRYGQGKLTIREGGTVTAGGAILGDSETGVGEVTVDGGGSAWTSSGNLSVGNLGSGILMAKAGAHVTSENGYIACNSGSIGHATITGHGSTWVVNGSLAIGGAGGNGVLTIADGGTVIIGNAKAPISAEAPAAGDSGTLIIWPTGTLNLNGGTISGKRLINDGTLNHTAGVLDFPVVFGSGSLSVGDGTSISVPSLAQHGVSIAPGARLSIVGDGAEASVVNNLSIAGSPGNWTGALDLGSASLVLQHTDTDHGAARLIEITDLIASAMKDPAGWANGKGITSSSAANDPRGMTALGVLNNDDGHGNAIRDVFGQVGVDHNAILVKFTWNGDANLDGLIDADDYFQIDSGYITQNKGWYNGDFNYDGIVNADDYFLIDSAFIGQTGILGARSVALVPEVSTLALGAFGLVGVAATRRRRAQ